MKLKLILARTSMVEKVWNFHWSFDSLKCLANLYLTHQFFNYYQRYFKCEKKTLAVKCKNEHKM